MQSSRPIVSFVNGTYKEGVYAYATMCMVGRYPLIKHGAHTSSTYHVDSDNKIRTKPYCGALNRSAYHCTTRAELLAITNALSELTRIGAEHVVICTDSQDALNILNYEQKDVYPDLYSIVMTLQRKFKSMVISHISARDDKFHRHGLKTVNEFAKGRRMAMEATLRRNCPWY